MADELLPLKKRQAGAMVATNQSREKGRILKGSAGPLLVRGTDADTSAKACTS